MGHRAATSADEEQDAQRDDGPSLTMGSVPHLSSTLHGGAAIAAHRICAAQREAGIDAHLFYRSSSFAPDPQSTVPHHPLALSRLRVMTSKGYTAANRILTQRPSVLFSPFEASLTPTQVRRLVPKSRIIALHNPYNVVRVQVLREAFPEVHLALTFHDERMLTSGCHYTLGCERFITGCSRCPQCRLPLPIGRMGDHLHRFLVTDPHVSVITPSHWLREQAIRAGLDPGRVIHLPNPIDPAIFTLKQTDPGVHPRALTVGWLPGKLERPFWQAILLANATMARHVDAVRINVLTTSSASVPAGVESATVEAPTTEADRARFWQRVGIGVSLTPADNFPNVVIEALCVGTPFVINDVGGAAEALRATEGGVVLGAPDPQDLADVLVDAARNIEQWQQRGIAAAGRVRDLYSPAAIGTRYLEHYRSAITAPRKGKPRP